MEEQYAVLNNDELTLAIIEGNVVYVRTYSLTTKEQKRKERVMSVRDWEDQFSELKDEHIVLSEPLRGVKRVVENVRITTRNVAFAGLSNIAKKMRR